MYVIVWEFIIQADFAGEFEAIYGPQGDWARLFAKAEDYRGTQLLRDISSPSRYVTLDLWTSREAHEKFRREYDRDYKALDERCAKLTLTETKLGEFDRVVG